MRLEDARKVVARAPKTELGLAARLVLWELERREELADPAPRIKTLEDQLSEERKKVEHLWYCCLKDQATAAEERLRREHAETQVDALAKHAAKKANELDNYLAKDHEELERLRRLEQAVKEVQRGLAISDRARRTQERIVQHLAPHLLPDH